STDSTLRLWDTNTNLCARTFTGHINEKNFVGLTTTSDWIACGSEDNLIFAYYKNLCQPVVRLPYDCRLRCSGATHLNSRKTVDYIIELKTPKPIPPLSTIIPSDLSSILSSQTDKDKFEPIKQSSPNKSQYALYDNNEGFLKCTPGIQQKHQVQIDLADDDRTITITAENLVIEENGSEIENNLSTMHADHPVNVNVEHGITTAKFKIKANKRKVII
ncbi:5243_t:CDS:2, partial [Ambispora gerdemannii]